jgi:Predicted endonuclease distantly related to archaeal Holliday junction resolvase and Mrr-like restriction enzymes
VTQTLAEIDHMNGPQFEIFMQGVYRKLGYGVVHTPISGDQGADLILTDGNGQRTAVQIKRYLSKVSNSAVKEVVASKGFYKCTEGIVVTNDYFTPSAIQLAIANKIQLVDRNGPEILLTKEGNN